MIRVWFALFVMVVGFSVEAWSADLEVNSKAFIEWHRKEQDRHFGDSGFQAVTISHYQDLKKAHPNDPIYFYLEARVEPDVGVRKKLGEEMISHWPNFAYGYQFLAYNLGYEQPSVNFSRTLELYKKAAGLDSSPEVTDAVHLFTKAVQAEAKARSIAFSFDEKMLNRYSTRKVKIAARSPSSLQAEYFQNEYLNRKWEMVKKSSSTIDLKLIGPTSTIIHHTLTEEVVEQEPGFVYELSVKESLQLKITKHGVMDSTGAVHRYKDIYVSSDAFRTHDNRFKIYLTAEDVLELKDLQVVELSSN